MRRASAVSVLGFLILAGPLSAAADPAACRPSPAPVSGAPAEPMSAVPCVAGFAGPYPCKNVDLMSHVPLAAMGCGGGNSLWGWTDPLDGREYALMGCDNGISFVDISVPDAAVYLGRLPTHEHVDAGAARRRGVFAPKHEGNSLWRDVRVYANHAFVVSEPADHGMQVFDLTQLRDFVAAARPSPRPRTTRASAPPTRWRSTRTPASSTRPARTPARAACTSSTRRTRVNPTFAGCVADDGYTHETQCVTYHGPDADYAGRELCFSSNADTLTIVDVTDKATPGRALAHRLRGRGVHAPGLAHRGPGLFPHERRARRGRPRPQQPHLRLGRAPTSTRRSCSATTSARRRPSTTTSTSAAATPSSRTTAPACASSTSPAWPPASLAEVAYFDIYPADDDPEFNGNWNNYPFFPSGNVILSGIEQGLFVVRPNLSPNPTTLTVTDVSVGEGDAGTSTLSFEVRLSVAVPQTVTVGYQTQFQTATAGVDYEGVAGTLTFDPGVTSRTVDVTVYGDILDEANETFRLVLVNPDGASMADPTGVATIVNDDPLPALSVSDVSVTEGESGNVAASFVVSLSAPSGQDVSATLETASGTALAGSDFVSRTVAAALPAGTTETVIDVQVRGDDRDEDDEAFVVNLSLPSHATIADGQGTGTILDDDTLAVHSASPGSGPAAGGAMLTLAGESFENNATVEIGGAPATGIVVAGSTGINALAPALDPGTVNDVVVTLPNQITATLPAAYLADFLDVDAAHPFHAFVEAAALSGVTAGCGGGDYCPDTPVTRAQMAVFLLKALYGAAHVPPPAGGAVFGDVGPGDFAAEWIEELAALGVTGGCGNGNYCPGALVTRAQMAVFLLKASEGTGYAPPVATGVFQDVPVGSFAADWIEELYGRGITGGCGAAPLRYCPANANTRGQMAVFLVKTFGL